MHPAPGRAAPRIAVIALAIGAAAVLAWLGWSGVAARQAADAATARAERLSDLRAEILRLDELLAMTALLAVATGDRYWAERYEAATPGLEGAIREAMALAPPAAVAPLRESTDWLDRPRVRIERQAIMLVSGGARDAASALLDGADDGRQRRLSGEALDGIFAGLDAASAAHAAALDRRAVVDAMRLGVVAALLAGTALVLGWRARLRAAIARGDIAGRRDPLTGLWNRQGLAERIAAMLSGAGGPLAVLLVDLDRFRSVNDAHGPDIGDRLLVEAARRLAAEQRGVAALGRLGGDQFALAVRLDEAAAAERAASRLAAALSRPFVLDGAASLSVGASIGIALAPADGGDAAGLLRAAEIAMYGAKAAGRGRARRFDPALERRMRQRAAIESALRAAVATDALEAHFQPQVRLRGARPLVGFEMLARWTHPVHGPVPPSVFVAAAEDSDLIADIAAGLLRRACRAAAGWPASLSVSVNVSPLQLRDRTLVPVVQAALAESGLAPTRLELELTEGAVVGDLDLAREVLAELDSLGVRIALDDFGTGYSSLQHLTALPISRLKIDAGFVRGMTTDSESRKIVAAVLGLGQSFGLPTVAEGIEDEASALALEAMGCDTGQGWLFGQALPAAEATALALSGRLGHGGASVPGSGLSRIDLDRV